MTSIALIIGLLLITTYDTGEMSSYGDWFYDFDKPAPKAATQGKRYARKLKRRRDRRKDECAHNRDIKLAREWLRQ
jgi:hypothetical protein